MNVGLKSGTNRLHGTAFAFGRDGAMDARNYFNCASNPCAFGQSPTSKVARSLEQFGGSLGGAIIKDKAFFFGAYEGQRYNIGNSFGGDHQPVDGVAAHTEGPLFIQLSGDCADSIPDAIADLLPNGYTSAGVSSAPQPANLRMHGFGTSVTCDGTGFPINNARPSHRQRIS